VCANVDDFGRGGRVGHQPDVQKLHFFAFSGVVESDPPNPPPCPRASGVIYMLRFRRFYARFDSDVRGRKGVSQTDDVGQEGECPKSQFC